MLVILIPSLVGGAWRSERSERVRRFFDVRNVDLAWILRKRSERIRRFLDVRNVDWNEIHQKRSERVRGFLGVRNFDFDWNFADTSRTRSDILSIRIVDLSEIY